MASSSNNVSIAPANVLWRIESEWQIDYAGITAASLDAKFITFSDEDQSVLYYMWHDLDAGSVDPAPAGRTGVEVDVATGDSASTMATAAAAALDALTDISATSSGSVVSVKLDVVGKAEAPADVDTNIALTVCRIGQNLDLGLLEGDVELSIAPANFILTSHQTGVTPRAALLQGFETLECTTVLQETVNSKLSEIYGIYGTTGFIPAGGTSVFGGGTNKNGNNLLIDAARLVLKPVNSTDDLGNTNLMLTIPIPDSLVFSGENPKTLSVTWQGFVDDTKDSQVNAFSFGDGDQVELDN